MGTEGFGQIYLIDGDKKTEISILFIGPEEENLPFVK